MSVVLGSFVRQKRQGPPGAPRRRPLSADGLKTLLLVLGVLLAVPATAGQDRIWSERFRLFPVLSHYSCGFYGQQFIVAVFMLENGPEGRETGYDNRETERDVCPCVPRRDRGFAQTTQAMHRAMEVWVLKDDWRRREFMRWWATYYHANDEASNKAYALQMRSVWARAGAWMKARGMDRLKTCDLRAFSPCAVDTFAGTVWTP